MSKTGLALCVTREALLTPPTLCFCLPASRESPNTLTLSCPVASCPVLSRPVPSCTWHSPRCSQVIEPIQSRCAIVRFTKVSDADVLLRLQKVSNRTTPRLVILMDVCKVLGALLHMPALGAPPLSAAAVLLCVKLCGNHRLGPLKEHACVVHASV